jgi:hypothetical protein
MTTLTTTLSVSASGSYTATPPSQTVTESNTSMVYELDKASQAIWRIDGLSSTDTKQQLTSIEFAPSGNSVTAVNANTKAESFSITISVAHRTTAMHVAVDPEVNNIPPD